MAGCQRPKSGPQTGPQATLRASEITIVEIMSSVNQEIWSGKVPDDRLSCDHGDFRYSMPQLKTAGKSCR